MSSNLEDCKYSIPHRADMIEVLKNWKVGRREKDIKVLQEYLSDLETNKSRECESTEISTDYNIIQDIKSKLAEDEREFNLAYYKSLAELYRAEKNLFEVKAAMLGFLKSQMKEATVQDFYESLLDLPDELLESKATILDFCESLNDLCITEERKRWLLQKTVESDIISAYDDAMQSSEEREISEKFHMMQFQEVSNLSGVEYAEENKLADDDDGDDEEDNLPCKDMDSFGKRLKVMEGRIKKKEHHVGQVYQTQHPARRGLLRISMKYVDLCYGMRYKSLLREGNDITE